MKTKSKKIDETLEIIRITVNKALTITVEVFKVPEGFRSIAMNSHIHQQELVGTGFHEEKQTSMDLAIEELRELMVEFKQTPFGKSLAIHNEKHVTGNRLN